MKKKILVNFGEKVRKKRLEQGFSQEDLADKAGVHRTYIGMIERAEKNITLLNIEKIASALNLSLSTLLIDMTKTWDQEIREICQKYNIALENLPAIIQDPKVLPMIRGKSFEFSTLSRFIEFLDRKEWDVSKLILNPQFGTSDEDVTLTHLKTKIKITIECKLAAKGRYRSIKKDGKNYFQVDVKCMRSRTLGDKKIQELAPKIGISENVLKIHNDQYVSSDFDIVVTSIANAFYQTDKITKSYEWKPKNIAIEFLKAINNNSTLNLDNADNQKNFAFEQIYIALSKDITAKIGNSVLCTRKKCTNKEDCGFIPNYPKITFDISTGKPLHPWYKIEDCITLLETFLA